MNGIVHIVDDEEVIRDSLSWLIGSEEIAYRTWARGEDFLADLPDTHPACVILDVRMEGLNGPAVFQRMLDAGSDIPVIFLTGHAEVPLAVEALKKGAFDFVEKPFNDNRLVALVRRAFDHHAGLRAIASDRAALATRLASLSPREREVLDLVIAGKMNKQIAGTLDLAVRTVEVHRASILEKFGVRSAIELAGLLARLDKND
jgi:two-component system, LuxR family, response regulator DctR